MPVSCAYAGAEAVSAKRQTKGSARKLKGRARKRGIGIAGLLTSWRLDVCGGNSACTGDVLDARALTCGWATHPFSDAAPDLSRIEIELREGSTKGVAVHSELFGGLALISFVMRENLKEVTAFELTERVGVRDTGAMHLGDKAVQFALQSRSSLTVPGRNVSLIVTLWRRFDPASFGVLSGVRCA